MARLVTLNRTRHRRKLLIKVELLPFLISSREVRLVGRDTRTFKAKEFVL